jgi:hypothetical protein
MFYLDPGPFDLNADPFDYPVMAWTATGAL